MLCQELVLSCDVFRVSGKTAVFINIYMFENMVTRYGDLSRQTGIVTPNEQSRYFVTRSKSPPSRTEENRRTRAQVVDIPGTQFCHPSNVHHHLSARANRLC